MSEHYIAGNNLSIDANVILGYGTQNGLDLAKFGDNCIFRAGTTIYGSVEFGNYVQTGHNVMVRENTKVGDHVVIGTNTVIDGNVEIGDFVKIESSCYIPTHVKIGTRVFIGPGVVLTNDQYPLKLRDQYKPLGPIIEDGVTIGGSVTIVPGVTIGSGSFIAAGAVVTKDIPPMSLVRGVPGMISPMPEKLKEENLALSWRKYLNE